MRWIIVLYLLLTLAFPLFSASDTPYKIPRITGEVKLDGLSDESAWQGILPVPVVRHTPNFGNRPSEKTEIFLAHDKNFLYVAGRLYVSDPSLIQAASKKRDELSPSSDWFGVVIDSFNDKENGLCFFTTPAGLRLDMTVFNDAEGEYKRICL